MKILIGCEESQAVCKAFRAKGHEAYSCDLQPCSGGHPEWHIQDDVLNVINNGWDMAVFHPECRFLTNSGVLRLYKHGKKENGFDNERWLKMVQAGLFFITLWHSDIPKVAIENPIPHGYAMNIIRDKYSQIIQPYNFGDNASKSTCLWLKGLPLLKNTNYCPPDMLTTARAGLISAIAGRITWVKANQKKEQKHTPALLRRWLNNGANYQQS